MSVDLAVPAIVVPGPFVVQHFRLVGDRRPPTVPVGIDVLRTAMGWAMDRIVHFLMFFPGDLEIAPAGSGLRNTACIVKDLVTIKFDMKLEPGVGIVIRLPLLAERNLRTPKINAALEPFVDEPFTDTCLEIGANEFNWGEYGRSALDGYEFGTNVAGGADIFQLKVISDGPGRDCKFLIFTCSSGGDIDRFFDALLGM
jgi:hypothetical protein